MNEHAHIDPPTVVVFRPSRWLQSPPEASAVPPQGPGWQRPEPEAMPPWEAGSASGRPRGQAMEAALATLQSGTPGSADSLVLAATPLLTLVALLRDMAEFAGVAQLRSEVIRHIHLFEEAASHHGAGAEDIRTARYILCSLIDETVMTTPWGSASDWSTNSLLNRFHNETWGGETVFAILGRLKAAPQTNIALLKLLDVVLLLGFQGMHRVLDDGRERLATLSEEMRRLVGYNLPPVRPELSRHWQGVRAEGTLRSYVPLWTVFAAAGLLLLVAYSTAHYRLSTEVAPVVAHMHRLEDAVALPGRHP